jgi:hypothetical protein
MELVMDNELDALNDEFWLDYEKDHQLTLKKEIKKGKKLDPVDYFYYLLRKLYKANDKKNKLDMDNENDFQLHLSYYSLQIEYLGYELFKIKNKILSIYELSDFKKYSKTNKATLLTNPVLFGISPFLFEISTREWFNFIGNDINNYGKFDLKLIEKKIYCTLNNALDRIGAKAFPKNNQYHWASEEVDSKYFCDNLIEDLFEAYGDRILDDYREIEQKENRMFLNSIKLSKSKINIDRIVLQNYSTGNIIDTLTGSFKGAKALNDKQKREIRDFVSMIFVNKIGKKIKYTQIRDIRFISTNIKRLTETLKSEKKFKHKCWTNKKLSELICNVSPDHFKLKTIENY